MTHEIDPYDHYVAGESITWRFDVTDEDGTSVDITNATVEWELHDWPGEDRVDAVLDDGDTDVTVDVTDPSIGVFEVTLAPGVTADLAGDYWQRVTIDLNGQRQIWNGPFPIERA
jgi:hypothetical protein